jgi:hypothetical protein
MDNELNSISSIKIFEISLTENGIKLLNPNLLMFVVFKEYII